MKKNLLALLALALSFSASAADDLVFKMVEDGGVTIVSTGSYDLVNQCIGNTAPGTTLCFGEIDFGNGDVYFANSADFAHENENTEGTLDFYLGHPDEGGKLFTCIDVKGTRAFQYYRTFRYNFYPEGTDGFTFPTGKHTVYMRYNNCEGNLKKVVFYGHEFTEEEMGEVPDPTYTGVTIPASQGTVVNKDEFPDVRLNDNGGFGWTGSGLIVKFADVDFKDGKTYGQIATRICHGGTDAEGFLQLYIDSYENEDNMIAELWTSRDFCWRVIAPIVGNIEKEITGKHDVYVKWTRTADFYALELIEGTPWNIEDDQPAKLELVDEPLNDTAYGIHFDAMGGIENTVDFMATGSDNLQYEAANLGYTSNGVVLRFNAVDFKNGEYTRILVDHSSDQSSLGSSTFDFYVDLDHDSYDDLSVLAGDTKIATVPAQGTADWSKHLKTAGKLNEKISGEHDLYMVFNTSAGANIHGVYLDTDYDPNSSGIVPVFGEGNVVISGMQGAVGVSAEGAVSVVVYNVAGCTVANACVNGSAVLPLGSGLYIVKVTEAGGNVTTAKVAVR